MVGNPKGGHFRTMGKAQVGGVHLLPEEALYLVGRGGLDLRWGEESGVPLSLQAAYTFLIGAEGNGVTLERFTVYAGLKRSGYIVQREPTWGHHAHAVDNHGHSLNLKQDEERAEKQPLGLFTRIYRALFQARTKDPPAQGPLVGVGFYQNYSQYMNLLNLAIIRLISGNNNTKTISTAFSP